MKLTSEQKYKVLTLLAPYVEPREIKEEFGITYNTLNHFCKNYDIPKWRNSFIGRKKENQELFREEEAYNKQLRIRMAKDLLDEIQAKRS